MSPDLTRTLRHSLAILACVTVVTAWFSELFYFPDEHYQILEFMGYKLGIIPDTDLRWEYGARVRPWIQPFLYFLIAKPLLWLGLHDMFAIVFVLRLVTGLFSVAALAVFAKQVLETIDGEEQKRAFARYLPFFGFLPYLFVRTASETLAAAFIAIGFAFAMRAKSARILVLSGLMCGMAFEARYQTAVMGLGLFAWLAVIARVRPAALAAFAGGGIAALLLGAVADRWGYGAWVFPPWDYFHVNIVQGVAASFGREPVFAYLYLMPAQFFFAITLVLMAAMAAMWLRNPRHPVTWGTLPFVLLHVAVAHKEARFLFPLAILATAFPVLGFSPRLALWRGAFARIWLWRHSIAAKVVVVFSVVGMVYFALYPSGVRPHMPIAKHLYRHVSGSVYSFDEPFQSFPIYRRAGFRSEKLQNQAQLNALLEQGTVYLLSEKPTPPRQIPADARVTMLYSEFPLTRFGYGAAGTSYIHGYTAFAARHRWLRLVPLSWYTLYRVERSAAIRS